MDSQQLFTQICGFLDQQDWTYQPDPEQQRLLLSVNDIAVLIAVEENGEFIKIILPQLLTVPADHPHYEAALETLAYFGLQHKLVRWQRDPEDGEVRVQADLPIEDSELTAKQFWRTLRGAVQIAQQGQERLQQVLATGQDTGNSQNPGTNQKTLAFFGALLQAENEGGETAVYQVLDQRGGQLDPQLPQAAQTFLEMVGTAKPEMRDGVVGLIGDLANSLQQYPRGHREINVTVAIGLYHLVLEARPRETVPDKYARNLTNLGVAYQTQAQLGEQPSTNLKQAIAAYDEAANIRRELKLEKDLSSTLNNLGIAYLTQAQLGEQPSANLQKAINCYREALKFFRPQLLPVECLKTARALGNLGFQQGDWQMALEGYQTAMAAVDYSRTQRVSNAEREEVVAKSIYIYENAIQAAINLNDIPTALEIVERVRAKRLVDLLATADLYQNGDIPEPVRQYLQKLNDLDDKIAQKRGELGNDSRETKPDGSKTRQLRAATAVSEDIAQLEQQKAVILDQLSNLDEVVAKLRQVQPPKLADFIPLLQDSPGAAILSFYTTDDDTHIFILRHGETVPTCFTCQGQGYKTLQLWLRETWATPYISNKTQWVAQMSATLAELSRRLEIDRLIAEQLQGLDELILIPHLFLHQIPFAALPVSHPSASGTSPYQGEAGWGDDSSHTPPSSPSSPFYFGDKFLLRYAPSVQVLGFCHNRSAVTAQEYGIVENATNDLPCSGFEGAKVAEFFGVGQEKRLIGTDATRQKYRQLLENTTHLVSTHHAQSRYDNPQESGLLLSDGRITVSQLLSPGWRFKDLDEIFLSCCETGLFLPNSALDEPVAVSTGFLCAGARGVIASHWAIYDLSAALLSILYHNQRKAGKNRPVALQAAQQEMRKMTGAEFKSKYQKALEAHFKAEKARLQAIPGYDRSLLTRVLDSEKNIKRYAADKGCPFQEPVHWGSLGCYGLR